MAILNTALPKNLTEYPNSFKRQGSFPLEAYSVFYDVKNEAGEVITTALDAAKDYAKNNPIAYVGQHLTVVNIVMPATDDTAAVTKVDVYKIENEGGDLVPVGNTEEVEAAIVELQEYIGTIPNGEDGKPLAESIVEFINKKTEGIATDAALEELQGTVNDLEADVNESTLTDDIDGEFKGHTAQINALWNILGGTSGSRNHQESTDKMWSTFSTDTIVEGQAVVGFSSDPEDGFNIKIHRTALPCTYTYELREEYEGTDPEGATYYKHVLYQKNTLTDEETVVGSINVPLEMMVTSGEVRTLTEDEITADRPQGMYIILTIANHSLDKIYINAADLIEYVTGDTADDGVITTTVDDANVLTAKINDGTIEPKKFTQAIQDLLNAVSANKDNWDEAYTKSVSNATAIDNINTNLATNYNTAEQVAALIATAKQEAIDEAKYDDTTLTEQVNGIAEILEDKADASYVGTIPEGYTEGTIIAYINKKAEETLNSASGGSSESAASVLAALNTYKSENDPKVTKNTSDIADILTKLNTVAEGAEVNKIDKITLNNVELAINNKIVDIPAATADSYGVIRPSAEFQFNTDDGSLEINKIDASKLVGHLILDGGTASSLLANT